MELVNKQQSHILGGVTRETWKQRTVPMPPYANGVFSIHEGLSNNQMEMEQHPHHFEQNATYRTRDVNWYIRHPSQHRNDHQCT
jgi:hypothetical protein